MKTMEWKVLHDTVCEIARSAGRFLREENNHIRNSDIEVKGLHDYVTYVDRQAEDMIVSELRKLLPGAGFLAEESTRETGQADLLWVIDPLDGTTNYIHHIPVYAVSIALLERGRAVLGIVYEVNRDECFSTCLDGPALLNGMEIKVSETTDLRESLIATGFPYTDHSRLKGYTGILSVLMEEARGIRRLGSAAVDLAYVACGRFDGFFEYGLHPWDVAAGAMLVQNAGGRVGNFTGESSYLYGREIVAANPHMYPRLQELTMQHFKVE